VDGGGTVTLQANLTNNYKLYLILANDEPTQPNKYRGQSDFSLRSFEKALDRIGGAVQRAIFLGLRSMRLDETIDLDNFDPKLPVTLVGMANRTIMTNSNGDGLSVGPSSADVANAQTYAEAAAEAQTAAETAQTAAESAQTAAEAAQAAAEDLFEYKPHSVTQSTTNTLTGRTLDTSTHSSKIWDVEIIRGTTVIANGRAGIQVLNGTPRAVASGFIAEEPHGVTFDVTNTSGTVWTLQAILDTGAGDGTIKLSPRNEVPV
jgi:hypothetical protein